MFARELRKRLDQSPATKGIKVVAFTPSQTPGTRLHRDQPYFLQMVRGLVVGRLTLTVFAQLLLHVIMPLSYNGGGNVAWSGGALEFMVTQVHEHGFVYYAAQPGCARLGDAAYGKEFRPIQTGAESLDEAKAAMLWDLTEKMLGLA